MRNALIKDQTEAKVPSLEEQPLAFSDLAKYLNEFDVKDIPQSFSYSSAQEQRVPLNMLNGFKQRNMMLAKQEESNELEILSKLEQPSGGQKKVRMSSYSITPQGVHLHKGEELGMF